MSIKILSFYPLQIHRSPSKTILLKLLLTLWSPSSNPIKIVCSSFRIHSPSESSLSLLGTSSNCSPISVGFLQKPSNLTVIPSDPSNPTVRRHRPSFINSAPSPFIIICRHLPSTQSTPSKGESNHALHAAVMDAGKTRRLIQLDLNPKISLVFTISWPPLFAL